VHRVGSTLLVDDAAPVAAAVSHVQRKFGDGRPGVLEHNANLDIPHGNHLAAPPAPAALGAWQQQQLLEAKLLYHAFHADVTTHSAGEPPPSQGFGSVSVTCSPPAFHSTRGGPLRLIEHAPALSWTEPNARLLLATDATTPMLLTHGEQHPPLLCDAPAPARAPAPTPTTTATTGALALWGGPIIDAPPSSEGSLTPRSIGSHAPASPPHPSQPDGRPATSKASNDTPPLATMLPVAPGACALRTPLRAAIASLHPTGGVKTKNKFAVLADYSASSAASSSSAAASSVTASSAASASAASTATASASQHLAMVPVARGPSSGSDGDARSDTLSETWANEDDEEEEEEEEEVAEGTASSGKSWEGMDQSHLFEWKVDEFTVLVESDLVLFRNPAMKPVSLKLHNVEEPATTLTCLSTWLDNMFAQVEDLAICYHHQGQVRGPSASPGVSREHVPGERGEQATPIPALTPLNQSHCSPPTAKSRIASRNASQHQISTRCF